MWSLGPEAFVELLEELGAPRSVTGDAWLALGGNPRLALALRARSWRLERLKEDLYRSIRILLEPLRREARGQLAEVAEDVDAVMNYPQLLRHLLDSNLITPVDRPCIGYTPPVDPELGVGRHYAWQTPLHHRLTRKFLREHG